MLKCYDSTLVTLVKLKLKLTNLLILLSYLPPGAARTYTSAFMSSIHTATGTLVVVFQVNLFFLIAILDGMKCKMKYVALNIAGDRLVLLPLRQMTYAYHTKRHLNQNIRITLPHVGL